MFKPTAEQALRSIQSAARRRLNTALAFLSHMNTLRSVLKSTLGHLGFRKENSTVVEGPVWSKRSLFGTVWLNIYEFRHHGPRLELEIGVVLDCLMEEINGVCSELQPFGGSCWHPLFLFGWALGQESGTEGGGEGRISFEGNRGALFLETEDDMLLAQGKKIIDCVQSVAMPIFERAAETGELSVEMFHDSRRFSHKYSA